MNLNELIRRLTKLSDDGYGDAKVFAIHGASGACDEVGPPRVSDTVGNSGPFDLEEGEEYISVYIGN